MLKKRIIFTLLYDQGDFVLSRNFRLQKVGGIDWLKNNYNFSKVSNFIDELIVLDISREKRNHNIFCEDLKKLTEECFIPISAGGGIRTSDHAKSLLRSGADKIVINSLFENNLDLIQDIAKELGQQCLVASIDLKKHKDAEYDVLFESGTKISEYKFSHWIKVFLNSPVGEIYVNSIDQDGTGNGYDFDILKSIPIGFNKPIIMAGGAGNAKHLEEGLKIDMIDAVATAHLFNFIGNGLKQARDKILDSGILLPSWNIQG